MEQGCRKTKYWRELFCDRLARQAEVTSAYLEGDMLRVGSGRNVVRGLRIVEGSVSCGLNRAGLYGRSKSKTGWKHSRKA